GEVQVDIALQMNRAGKKDARRYDDAPAPRVAAGSDGFTDCFGVVGFAVSDGSILGNRKVTIGKRWRFNTAQNDGNLLPTRAGLLMRQRGAVNRNECTKNECTKDDARTE